MKSLHVVDLVRAHILALNSIEEGRVETYNLGSENGFSVLEVLKTCQEITGKNISTTIKERRPGDANILVANSMKIRTELGWRPLYPDLATIIKHAWLWHSRHPHGYEK